MTTKAISLLKDSDRGFFLQVEGVSIDKKAHAANACGQIGEAVDLDEAVEAAMKFAKADGNTSVFVTADHAHTSQIVEAGVTPGITVNLLTADDAPMTISCATAAAGGSQQHTTAPSCGSRAYGPQAANIVGLTDQTELFFTISRALRLG